MSSSSRVTLSCSSSLLSSSEAESSDLEESTSTSSSEDGSDEDGSPSNRYCLGKGRYGCTVRTSFERTPCAVKGIRQYSDRSGVDTKAEREAAQQEQLEDITTEVSLLSNCGLHKTLDWDWLPRVYAVHWREEIVKSGMADTARDALGFDPAVLIYMELLDERLDKYIARTATTKKGASDALRLMCDVLAVVVEMHRNGVRHNDLMFRNIMVRLRRPVGTTRRRALTLRQCGGGGRGNRVHRRTVTWSTHPECELALIDFGLSSVARNSAMARVPHVITHGDRDKAYARDKAVDLESGAHPLVLPLDFPLRECIDIHCVAHSLKSLGASSTIHPVFRKWCDVFIDTMYEIHHESYRKKRAPPMERIIYQLFPESVCSIKAV